MPNSKRWTLLSREIAILRGQFLPDPFDPLGTYPHPTRVQAYARAFLVLSHAEIESFLEDWAKDIARASEAAWTSTSRVTPPMAFLLSFVNERVAMPKTLAGPASKDTPQRLAESAVKLYQEYYKRIRDNHGIRESNVLGLFGPLGIPSTALGATLLPNLDNLGALRGVHAHQSAKAVRSVLDPETEYKRVSTLLGDLVQLDQWLVVYKRRIK